MTTPTAAADISQHRLALARASRALLGVVAMASVLALSACGGGTQVEKFQPSTMVVLGDESSAFAPLTAPGISIQGGKYGVNDVVLYKGSHWPVLKSDGTPDVAVAPSLPNNAIMKWTHASDYPTSTTTPPGNETTPATLSDDKVAVKRTFTIDVPYVLDTAPTAPPTQAVGSTVEFQYAYHCQEKRLWTQILANSYGLGFGDECAFEGHTGAYSYAVANAGVADIQAQVTQASTAGHLGSNTLVTVLAGQNDVIAAYEAALNVGSSSAQEASMSNKGRELATIINSISATGARVAFLTLPALQYSPKVRTDQKVEPHAVTYMTALVKAFNDALKVGVINNGHKFAFVDIYSQMVSNDGSTGMAVVPSSFALTNVSDAWCQSDKSHKPDGTLVPGPVDNLNSLLYCNSLSGPPLDTAAPADNIIDPYTYLWADDTHVGPAVHAAFGGLAYSSITRNPL